jgi:hypothetical protein
VWTAVDDSGNRSTASQDITVVCTVAIGNLVWKDSNGDGSRQAGEPGIPAVSVHLYSSTQTPGAATPLRTTTTDSQGLYRFDGLAPACYRVYLPTPPADCTLSTSPSDPADNREDNDDNGAQNAVGQPVTSPLICLAAGAELTTDGDDANGDLTVDFGFVPPPPPTACVGDTVWIDIDRNGLPDENLSTQGVPGVVVSLYRVTTGGLVFQASATTSVRGANRGFYEFCGLAPGEYCVIVDPAGLPADFQTPTTVLQKKVTLVAGQYSQVEDFGFIATPTAVSLGEFTASSGGDGVNVNWSTLSETRNLGFNLYRSAAINGRREPVNFWLIEAAGGASGAPYEWLDAGAPSGRLFYWLEDVDFEGTRKIHGPALVLHEAASLEARPSPAQDDAAALVLDASLCQQPWTVPSAGNWLLEGFPFVPEVLGLGQSGRPMILNGEVLSSGQRKSIYLHLPANEKIIVRPRIPTGN